MAERELELELHTARAKEGLSLPHGECPVASLEAALAFVVRDRDWGVEGGPAQADTNQADINTNTTDALTPPTLTYGSGNAAQAELALAWAIERFPMAGSADLHPSSLAVAWDGVVAPAVLRAIGAANAVAQAQAQAQALDLAQIQGGQGHDHNPFNPIQFASAAGLQKLPARFIDALRRALNGAAVSKTPPSDPLIILRVTFNATTRAWDAGAWTPPESSADAAAHYFDPAKLAGGLERIGDGGLLGRLIESITIQCDVTKSQCLHWINYTGLSLAVRIQAIDADTESVRFASHGAAATFGPLVTSMGVGSVAARTADPANACGVVIKWGGEGGGVRFLQLQNVGGALSSRKRAPRSVRAQWGFL